MKQAQRLKQVGLAVESICEDAGLGRLSLQTTQRGAGLSAKLGLRRLRREKLINLDPVGLRYSFHSGKPHFLFSSGFEGLIVFVADPRQLTETLLRQVVLLPEFAQAGQKPI